MIFRHNKTGNKMKEKVLIHKETGELYLFTNTTTTLKINLEFWFLISGDRYYGSWNERDFIELGEL